MTPALAGWHAAWATLGQPEPPAGLLDRLLAAYNEPGRHYHNLIHIEECFAHLGSIGPTLVDPPAVALALWFHDAVYDPRRPDNEARNADWAAQALDACLTGPAVESVRNLILATDHRNPAALGDPQAIVGIDLAILGAGPDRFDEYEAQVRLEYAWVPEPEFRAGRSKILRSFQSRPTLYATEPFRMRFEAPARANIARSLQLLGA